MLLENFYKIIHIKEREDGKQEIEIELNPRPCALSRSFPRTAGGSGRLYLTDNKRKCRTDRQPTFAVCTDCFFQVPVCHQPAENSATTDVYPIRKNGRAPFQVAGRRHL